MIAIISDIHGNYEALKAILKDIDKQNIEEIYCLGDVVGYYSQVNECCEELRYRNIKCVMGNHDWYMSSNTYCPRSKSANDCLEYQRKIITKENKDWISSFPLILKEHGIVMVHGSYSNPIDDYLEPNEEYFEKMKEKYFVSGHCHIQRLDIYKNKIYCNPGSVGQPRDNNPMSAYAVFDDGKFLLYRVPYDIKKVGELMDKAGFNPYYYGCLNDGARNLHK